LESELLAINDTMGQILLSQYFLAPKGHYIPMTEI